MLLALASVVFLGYESLGTRDHILLSDLRLPFSSPPTTRKVAVEVFDHASTRVTAVLRDSFNFNSAGLGSSLRSLGSDPIDNTVYIVTAPQYVDCCLTYALPRESVYRDVA
jgi:hypothetical protein